MNIFFTEIALDFGWSGAMLVNCVEKELSLHEITNKRWTSWHQLKNKVQEKYIRTIEFIFRINKINLL